MCLNPISIKTNDSFGILCNQSVPCGKCLECLKDKQNAWKIRLIEESRDHLYVYFFTLTYRDDSVPYVINDGIKELQVSKNDIQLWIKRNRIFFERTLNRDIDLKYFVCSEYGPNTGRPHYHGILFTDISPTFVTSMFNDWICRFGYVNFSEVGKNGAKKSHSSVSSVGDYVAKYCVKPPQMLSDVEIRINQLINDGVISPTFYLMSKGIGKNYVNRLRSYHLPKTHDPKNRVSLICDRAFYHDGAFKYKLPRYYRDRLYRMKFPCEAKVWSPKDKRYVEKIVYRYQSKNMLARQMQVEVRNRVLVKYGEDYQRLRFQYPSKSDTEIHLELSKLDKISRNDRRKNIYQKMSRFYNSNRFNNRKL